MKKFEKNDLSGFSSDPVEIFYGSIKAPVTKRIYEQNLKYFLCRYLSDFLEGSYQDRIRQFVKKGKEDTGLVSGILQSYVMVLKKQTELPRTNPEHIAPRTILNRLKPISKLLELNDISFSRKKIRGLLPDFLEEYPDTRGYTKEEIRTMLKHCRGIVDQAIILVAASSGIRVGGFDFKWGDITPIYRLEGELILGENKNVTKEHLVCAKIIVYKGSAEKYDAFLTPEAYDVLLEYRKVWEFETKRKPAESDYVFKRTGPLTRYLGSGGITARIDKLLWRAGMKKPLENSDRRHTVPIMHGFRKFFNKTIKNTPSDSNFLGQYILKERMMGHSSLVSLDENYYRDHWKERVEEYVKCVPYLTILDDNILREENKKLERENSDIDKNLPTLVDEAVERMKNELLQKGWALAGGFNSASESEASLYQRERYF